MDQLFQIFHNIYFNKILISTVMYKILQMFFLVLFEIETSFN